MGREGEEEEPSSRTSLGPLQGRLKSDLQGARGECRGKRVLEKIIGQRPGHAAQAPPCGGRSWRIRFPTSPSVCSAPTFHAAESSSCRAEASARRELPAPWSLHAVSHTRGAGLLQAASQRAAFCGFCGDTAVNSGQASPAGALGQPRPWRPGTSSGPSSRTSRRARMGPVCRGKGASFIHSLIHSFVGSFIQ